MRAIDTNVLVRIIARDDPRQVAEAERFVRDGAWVSTLVLAEAIWVTESVYDLTPQGQAKAIEMLLEHHDLVLQDAETVAGALQIFRLKPALGFFHCLILSTARKAGHVPLGTFDRDLVKMTGAHKL